MTLSASENYWRVTRPMNTQKKSEKGLNQSKRSQVASAREPVHRLRYFWDPTENVSMIGIARASGEIETANYTSAQQLSLFRKLSRGGSDQYRNRAGWTATFSAYQTSVTRG